MFECVVARAVWHTIAESFDFPAPGSVPGLCSLWLNFKKNAVPNMACLASMWSLWTVGHDMYIQGLVWKSVKILLGRISRLLRQWKILCIDSQSILMQRCMLLLDRRKGEMFRIAWVWVCLWMKRVDGFLRVVELARRSAYLARSLHLPLFHLYPETSVLSFKNPCTFSSLATLAKVRELGTVWFGCDASF